RRHLDPAPDMTPIPVFVSAHGDTRGFRGAALATWPYPPATKRAKSAFFHFATSRILAASLPVNVIHHRWRRNLDPAPYMAPIPVFVSTHGETPGARGAARASIGSAPCSESAKHAVVPVAASRNMTTH